MQEKQAAPVADENEPVDGVKRIAELESALEIAQIQIEILQSELGDRVRRAEQFQSSLSAQEPLSAPSQPARLESRGFNSLYKLCLRIPLVLPVLRALKNQSLPAERKAEIALLKKTNLFDAAWYERTYTDTKLSLMTPEEHYLLAGSAEGRDPSPLFSTREYEYFNPEVRDAGANALIHHLKTIGG